MNGWFRTQSPQSLIITKNNNKTILFHPIRITFGDGPNGVVQAHLDNETAGEQLTLDSNVNLLQFVAAASRYFIITTNQFMIHESVNCSSKFVTLYFQDLRRIPVRAG